jgi:hypothetical protein
MFFVDIATLHHQVILSVRNALKPLFLFCCCCCNCGVLHMCGEHGIFQAPNCRGGASLQVHIKYGTITKKRERIRGFNALQTPKITW